MGWLAHWLADRTWACMLWLMRRPATKALRRQLLARFPAHRRDRISESWIRQDRFARRIGRRLLYWSFLALLASIAVTTTYLGALWLIERDMLPLPRRT